MTASSHAQLVEALQRFLNDARYAVEQELHRNAAPGPPLVETVASLLATLPTCAEADAAAERAAADAGYRLRRGHGRRAARRPDWRAAGQLLNANALIQTGVAELLLARADLDLETVARDLGGYLAGPPIDTWDYVLLDAGLNLDAPIPVVDGWELVTPTADELRRLFPLPSITAYRPTRPFAPEDYSGLAMFRRQHGGIPGESGLPLLGFSSYDRLEYALWEPLLALSLYSNEVVRVTARYSIEPGRHVFQVFDRVQWDTFTLEDETEVLEPYTSLFAAHEAEEAPRLRHFLAEVVERLRAASSPSGKDKYYEQAAVRLRRCAEHFLAAGEHAEGEGHVLEPLVDGILYEASERRAEAVLRYVVALEGILAGADPDRFDYARKVSQRAAVLVGENDTHRLEIKKLVRDAYDARSKYAHGARVVDAKLPSLPELRWVVRGCLLTRLILGDPTQHGPPLHELADQALLSHDTLHVQVRQPVVEFWQQVQAG